MKTNNRIPNDTRHLLSHRDVVRTIEGALLRRGTPRQDLADGVARVQLAALEAVDGKPMPADVGEWQAFCGVIAERLARTERRQALRRGRWNDGLCEDPDEHVPLAPSPGKERDVVDARQELADIRAQLEAGDLPEHGAAILGGVADGLSAREIAQELGLTTSTVENRISRIRKRLRSKAANGGEEG
ncbi:MAG TPA: sigma-70 family RNA polymerase sigma factor [Polyangiaceae bacterium]|jgi:DNA-directed RNA polymerase specialized sigma24 family protein